MEQDESVRFDEKHLWVRDEGDEIVVGISQYLADQIGEITDIELPDEGSAIFRGDSFGTIEHSNEVVEELVAPLNGEVLHINEDLLENPDLLREDPYGDGWLLIVNPEEGFDLSTLMTYDEYESYIDALEEVDEDLDDLEDDLFADDFEDDEF